MTTPGQATYFRKGFGLKTEVQEILSADYTGHLVDLLRARDFVLSAGPVTVRLAKEFGFCYGVERAVEYAYQTRTKFPDRRIFLAGEIIHNPHVNAKLREMGIVFLAPGETGFDYSAVTPQDVVILPAFGVTIGDFETLRGLGCVMVDTTCGSVTIANSGDCAQSSPWSGSFTRRAPSTHDGRRHEPTVGKHSSKPPAASSSAYGAPSRGNANGTSGLCQSHWRPPSSTSRTLPPSAGTSTALASPPCNFA